MNLDLTGQIALVTGASRGIGKVCPPCHARIYFLLTLADQLCVEHLKQVTLMLILLQSSKQFPCDDRFLVAVVLC